MDNTVEKVCNKCHVPKHLIDFRLRKYDKTGNTFRCTICLDCERKQSRERERINKEFHGIDYKSAFMRAFELLNYYHRAIEKNSKRDALRTDFDFLDFEKKLRRESVK